MRTHGRSHVVNGRTGQQMPLDVAILEEMDKHSERYAIIERLGASTLRVALIQGTEDPFKETTPQLEQVITQTLQQIKDWSS